MYGQSCDSSTDVVHATLLCKNHHFTLYKLGDEPILEKPKPYDEGQGWIRTDEGVLGPVWCCSPVLQTSLVDLLDTGDCEEEEEGFDFDGFIESDDK